MEVAPGASASSPAPPGRGGEVDPGPAVGRSGAEANTPKVRALGKRAVSPVGSAAAAEQVAVEATPPPSQRTEGAPGSAEDRLAPMDTDATPLPPPPPLRMRFVVAKQGPPRSK
ncbi:predicted GPI-anchored protein 58 [Miscanthus floridulus]|uniref:predicted GPI-anchored protein 58 n=1 Tax=Miscanthus floridulus TaxID=154761 RepID=UPI00345A4A2E